MPEINQPNHELVIVLDFGGQYNQLIARRIRECHVYCEMIPFDTPLAEIKAKNPKGIVFSGGPSSVYGETAPKVSLEIYELGIPVLGICYGMQLMALDLGGSVQKETSNREYGKANLKTVEQACLFADLPGEMQCWMSHGDSVEAPPQGFMITASTGHTPVAAMENRKKKLFGVQFHPEVRHTPFGNQILQHFLFDICGCAGEWTMSGFIEEQIKDIQTLVGERKVLCGLSGGVDSAVAAVLVHQAIGNQLTCVFVDHGLMRKQEMEKVQEAFTGRFGMNVIYVNARERFLGKLAGVSDPERKRKIIGEEFIRVFEAEALKLGQIDFLVQGTLYPDIIESGTKTAATIKSHHNVGGLPDDMQFKLIEPLKTLFKDEVRLLGLELKMPEDVVWRQPFPGPGLGIRILGEITPDKLDILREADDIIFQEIKKAGLYRQIWQSFAVLPEMKSVGVMGDERTYHFTIILRAVTSDDAMTADWARLPYDVLESISSRIVNEVPQINRVVFDITSKPPATIEWE